MTGEIKFLVFRLIVVFVTLSAPLAGGCGGKTETIPACGDVDWVGRSDHAQLTGAPTFSALEIAPGDPVTISVPVDVNTRSVRAIVVSGDLPGVGSGGLVETNGGEVVDIPVTDTNLPAGVYIAAEIVLQGDRNESSGVYIADPGSPYVLSIDSVTDPHSSDQCVTEIAAPTFLVVSEASEEP